MAAAAHAAHHHHQKHVRKDSSNSNKDDGAPDKSREDSFAMRSSLTAAEAVREDAAKIFQNEWVIHILDLVILLNMLQMGVCAGNEDIRMCPTLVCEVAEHSFVAIFILEFAIKFWVLKMAYFVSYWNSLDSFLAVTGVLDAWILYPILSGRGSKVGEFVITLLYLIRLFRLFRVLRTRPKLLVIFEGLTSSIKSISSVCMLLGMIIYVSSIFCVTLFSTVNIESPLNFNNFPRALWTLFSLSIVADWTDIVSPVVDKYVWSPLFFVGFVFLATFGILNLIIGVITEKTLEIHEHYHDLEEQQKEKQKMRKIDEMAEMIFGEQDDGTITQEEMMEYVNSEDHGPAIREMVNEADLPSGYDIWDCHAMFDRDVSGSITRAEFVQGMGRLIFSNQFQRSAMTQIAIADVLVQGKAVENKIVAEIDRLRADLGLPTIERKTPDEEEAEAREKAKAAKAEAEAKDDPSAPAVESVPVAAPKMSARLPSSKEFDNLPSCKALVQRLQEPLTQLLADSLRDVDIPKVWPAPKVSVVKAGGLARNVEVTRGIRGKGGQSPSSSPKIEAVRGGGNSCAGGTRGGEGGAADSLRPGAVAPRAHAGDVDSSVVNDTPGGGDDSQRIAGSATELGPGIAC